jgi:hypothetical protein
MSFLSSFIQGAAQVGVEHILLRPKIRKIQYTTSADSQATNQIEADAVIEEQHSDSVEITQHPVEVGSYISDHAYKKPAELTITMGWTISKGLLSSALGDLPSIPIPSYNTSLNLGSLSPYIGQGAAILAQMSPTVGTIIGAAEGIYGAYKQVKQSTDKLQDLYSTLVTLQNSRIPFKIYTGKRIYDNMICKTLVVGTNYKTENVLVVTMTCQEVILVNSHFENDQSIKATPSDTGSPTTSAPTTLTNVLEKQNIFLDERDLKFLGGKSGNIILYIPNSYNSPYILKPATKNVANPLSIG